MGSFISLFFNYSRPGRDPFGQHQELLAGLAQSTRFLLFFVFFSLFSSQSEIGQMLQNSMVENIDLISPFSSLREKNTSSSDTGKK